MKTFISGMINIIIEKQNMKLIDGYMYDKRSMVEKL